MIKREDRAKQFAPFESLSGLRAALRQKELEHERVEKIELSEAREQKLETAIKKLARGDDVKVTYYSGGFYADVVGKITALSMVEKFIKVGDGKIFFDDLYDIKIL